MNYVLAVSGGIDSVALLDMAVSHTLQGLTLQPSSKLVVAHFDHGIRPDSDADARFVWELAKKYGLPFEVRREELGEHASEALARQRRYQFLRFVATKYDAKIVTAHHRDDIIESIAINLQRGTGWRGLAVMDSPAIVRPLLSMTKSELRNYMVEHDLEWVEDETNATGAYRRNQVRRRVQQRLTAEAVSQIQKLWQGQVELKQELDRETEEILNNYATSRYFFIMIPEEVALELLRRLTDARLTRPQMRKLLQGVKTARAGTTLELGGSVEAWFTRREFFVKTSGEML